jgi:hypothetical protein
VAKVEDLGWEKGAGQPAAPQIDGAAFLLRGTSHFGDSVGFSRAFSLERTAKRQPTSVKGSDAPLLIDTHSSWP